MKGHIDGLAAMPTVVLWAVQLSGQMGTTCEWGFFGFYLCNLALQWEMVSDPVLVILIIVSIAVVCRKGVCLTSGCYCRMLTLVAFSPQSQGMLRVMVQRP